MTNLNFGFQSFHVDNCRSKGDHNDSDWVTVTVTNGQTVFPTQTKLIGPNLHAGDQVNEVFLGPFAIDQAQLVTATFAVVNLSHTDDDEQAKKMEGIALAIGGGIAALSGGVLAVAGEITNDLAAKAGAAFVGVVGGVLGTMGGIIGLGSSDPNCDGEVLTRSLTFLPGELQSPKFIGPTTETTKSPSECGNDPHTTVTYGVTFARAKPHF
jgi:hypothetical protein